MAKVWAIVEVPYTQTNAWVMAVLAKVVGGSSQWVIFFRT